MRPGLILPLAKEHPELFVPKQLGDLLSIRRRRHREGNAGVKHAVGHQHVLDAARLQPTRAADIR
jgi:hypothetical protein